MRWFGCSPIMSTSRSSRSALQARTSSPSSDPLTASRKRGRAADSPPRISVPEWADRYLQACTRRRESLGQLVDGDRGSRARADARGDRAGREHDHADVLYAAPQDSRSRKRFRILRAPGPVPDPAAAAEDEAAEQFSKERITPMVRATPALREIVGSAKTRDADETLTYKAFPGGFLALAGAGSPDNLARRPIRVLLADEVDKYPVTREGDPISLAEERQATFGSTSLSIRACSPTVEDESRIAASEADSDQRRASVACPHCGHRQFLDFFEHVEVGQGRGARPRAAPAEDRADPLRACGVGWSEGERLNALQTIRWHQTRPFECCGQRHVPLDAYGRAWRNGSDAGRSRPCVGLVGGRPVGGVPRQMPGLWVMGRRQRARGIPGPKLYSPWQKDRPPTSPRSG